MIPRRWRRKAADELAPSQGELNIVPFLDIVTNLLLFLLATTASVLTTVDVEASLPSTCRGCPPTPHHDLQLSVTVARRGIVVASRHGVVAPGCEGTGNLGATVPRSAEGHDFAALTECMARVHARYPGESRVVLAADPEVPYDDLVRAMDAIRADERGPLFPDVLLSAGVR